MIINFKIANKDCKADLNQPIDLSITSKVKNSFKAWYCKEVVHKVIEEGDFIGSVKKGGSVNFKEITINPHGNMTHTESVAHICEELVPINKQLPKFHFLGQVITVNPCQIKETTGHKIAGDFCVELSQLENRIDNNAEALIIRTQQDYSSLQTKNYSNTNWPYICPKAASYIRNIGVKHLLIDQPSVDKELDGGKLLAHKAFWDYPNEIDKERTITELIGVPVQLTDGLYLLNLSLANIENDASPSRPIIYKLFF